LELPILYVGVGESEEDLIPFEAEAFVDGLLEGIFINESSQNG